MAMRGRNLLEKIGLADEKWVADAESPRKKRRITAWMCRIGAVAAAACIAWGCFVHTDAYLLSDFIESIQGPTEQVLRTRFCLVDRYLTSYRLVSLSEHQKEILSEKKGALYLQTKDASIYRYHGRDDMVYLICEQNGELQLLEFWDIVVSIEYEGDLSELYWAEQFTDEQLDRIVAVGDVAEEPMAEIMRVIYGIDGPEDIQSVTFRKRNSDQTRRGRSVKVKTVTLREQKDLEELYRILCSLQYPGTDVWYNTSPSEKIAERLAAVKAMDIPSVQFSRDVIIQTQAGYKWKIIYNGLDGFVRVCMTTHFLTDEANDWLIRQAEVDFTYQGYAENPVVTGCETTQAPMPPEENADTQDPA